MTRKHFEAIAAQLRYAHELTITGTATAELQRHFTWTVTMGCVADALNQQNPRFDRSRFIQACKPADCEDCHR